MPLSKVEREVLETICDEHRQTHRGAKALIVHVGMNAKTGEQKARIVEALHALQKRGLVVARDDAWLPTLDGKEALDVTAAESPLMIGFDMAQAGADKTVSREIDSIPQEGTWLLEKGERVLTHDHRLFSRKEIADVFRVPAHLLGNRSVSHDLISRCAAMNAALLAQAEQAHAAGDPDAWRELRWLIETGNELVAAGGAL